MTIETFDFVYAFYNGIKRCFIDFLFDLYKILFMILFGYVNTNMYHYRNKCKMLLVYRLGLTHRRKGVSKLIRENIEQVFAEVTRGKSNNV
jgi:hypothetical protein